MYVCEWLGPGYTSINSNKNAFNPYNSLSEHLLIYMYNLFWKVTVCTHVQFIDVRRAWIQGVESVHLKFLEIK